MRKRIGTIALALFCSFVSCISLNNPAPSSLQNINGSTQSAEKSSQSQLKRNEDELYNITLNPVLDSINLDELDSKNQSYNFIDSSKDAFTKLKSLINSGNYAEIFGKNIDEVHSRIFSISDQITIDGSVYQQSHSRTLNSHQKDSSESTFFYSSNPDQHTNQNCYIIKMKASVEKSVFEKLSDVFGAIDAKIYKRYQHGFLGYSICFPENTLPLSLMKEISAIEFVERDNVIKASQIQEDAPWGLARLSSPDPKSSYYGFDGTGQGVTVYVIDSGLSKIKGKS